MFHIFSVVCAVKHVEALDGVGRRCERVMRMHAWVFDVLDG